MLPITSSCAAAVATSGIIAFRIILNLRNAEPLERIPPGHSARKRKQTLCFQLFVHLLDKLIGSGFAASDNFLHFARADKVRFFHVRRPPFEKRILAMDTKRNVFDTKIVPLLGNRKMNEITALDIRDWQQRVKEMGEATGLPYSETYLYTIHAQLTALFNYAQTFYGLRFNPCDAAGYMGSSVAGEMLIITKDQYELLRKEFRNEAYLLAFDILFWTGCREGEMLALLPKDLTDDDQLRIYKTYHRKKGQDIFGPTKNSKKGGNRNVPIPHWLAEEFRTYCSRLYGLTPDDRVFYMTCTALNKELTRCTQLTYLPDIRVHDLRHSHVSLCIELGYSVVLVARRIGDTVPVVMRTYAHLYPNKQQELVSKLEAIGSPSSNDDESDLMSLG